MQGLMIEGGQGLDLIGLRGAAALLHRTQTCLDTCGELLATHTLNPFNQLLHASVGADAETDGALSHPGRKKEVGGC